MIRRLLVGTVILMLCLSGLATYGLYAPRPSLDEAPVQHGQIEIDGRLRSFQFVAPATAAAPMPVLLALHPSMSSGARMRDFVGPVFEPLAERQPMLIVYPDGFEGHFNDCRKAASYSARALNIDDVSFLQALVSQLSTSYPIDPTQIHVVGYSNGAHMGYRLAMEAPNFLRGLIAVAANLPTDDNFACSRARGRFDRAVLIQGTDDPINPYTGGAVTLWGFGHRGTVHSAKDSAAQLARWLGISGTPQASGNGATEVLHWNDQRSAVRLMSVLGGGHTVPQAHYRFPHLFGATLRDDAPLQSAWQLLSQP